MTSLHSHYIRFHLVVDQIVTFTRGIFAPHFLSHTPLLATLLSYFYSELDTRSCSLLLLRARYKILLVTFTCLSVEQTSPYLENYETGTVLWTLAREITVRPKTNKRSEEIGISILSSSHFNSSSLPFGLF